MCSTGVLENVIGILEGFFRDFSGGVPGGVPRDGKVAEPIGLAPSSQFLILAVTAQLKVIASNK